MPLFRFHPAVARWFTAHFAGPTGVQARAWPAIRDGRACLIAAPTGSGKTLAAFLAAIDQLLVEGQAAPLPNETRVLYVSPLKALSNDIHKNLELPLNGIRDQLLAAGLFDVPITACELNRFRAKFSLKSNKYPDQSPPVPRTPTLCRHTP